MSAAAVRPDPFVRAHQDAQKAVALFLPSLVGQQEPPPQPPPSIQAAGHDSWSEAIRVASIAKRGETMAARMARGLPPEPPQPTPEQQFGNTLDAVHIRALQEAIASVPEEDRGRLISEAHDSAVKWIASHNGKVVVHGKIELAHSPESAERLAAKIVNNEVEDHDQRRTEEEAAISQSALGGSKAAGGTSDGGRPDVRGAITSATQSAQFDPVSPPATTEPVPVSAAPTITPQIVPPGDGTPPAQGAPPPVQPQEIAKVGSEKDDGHQITQPKNSIAANQKLALDASPELHSALQSISAQVPGTQYDRIRPQKSTDRLDQKIEDNNDPDTLSDYLGAQVSADTPQAKDQMVALLKKNFKVIEVDDQFLGGRKDKAQYPSANVQVQLSNGVTAEVQIVPKEVQDATEQSHAYYKAGREAEDNGDQQERDRQWKQASDINQGQLAKFKARNGIQDQPAASVGGYEIMGQPIQIGSHTFLRVKQGGGNDQPQVGMAVSDATSSSTAGSGGDDNQPSNGTDDANRLAAPASARIAVGEDQTPRSGKVAKGSRVTLKDGTQATVAYSDPNMNVVRVRTADGDNRVINPTRDLADGPPQ